MSESKLPPESIPDDQAINPYAPSGLEAAIEVGTARTNLPLTFWVLPFLVAIALVFIATMLNAAILFWLPLIVTIPFAMLRVPLLQLRHSKQGIDSPAPEALLATSWFFTLMIMVASVIAFVAICTPLGFLFFRIASPASQNTLSDFGLFIPFTVGGICGLLAFGFLFRLSLRLPI